MQIFAVAQISVLKARVDDHLIYFVLQLFELAVGHAESPFLSIVRGTIRDEVGLFRQGVKVLPKLCERYVLAHGNTVAHDVEVRPGKVDNFFAAAVLDIGIANVPLARDRPIEDGSSRWYLVHLQCNVRSNFAQCLPHTIPGNAATNREYLGGEGEDFLAYSSVRSGSPRSPRRFMMSRAPTLACGSASRLTSKFGHQRGIAWAPGLGVPQLGIEDAVGQQLFDMPDALISRTLELFQCQAG